MPVYHYKGLTSAGKTLEGLREADNTRALRSLLKRENIFVTEVAEGQVEAVTSREVNFRRLFERVSAADVAILTRQLATLIGAGIPLVESLAALVDQIDSQRLKVIISQIKQAVNEGASLADAMGQHHAIFSSLYINMVRAGESSGALDVVLLRLADYTEAQARLKQKILGTLAYPAIMVVVGFGIMAFLFVFVVPKLTKIFEDINATLPIYTRVLIFTSNFAQEYWWLVGGALLAVVFIFLRWRQTAKGRQRWDRFVLRTPVFGGLIRMLAISRFSRTLATLLKSGVPLLTSLDIVKNIVNNSVLVQVIEDTRDAVREGESIAAPLKRSGELPPIVTHMIAVGERSGQLEEMLNKVAEAYDSQVDARIGALTTLLEPVMILLMGGSVAFIVLSILIPILQINEYVQ